MGIFMFLKRKLNNFLASRDDHISLWVDANTPPPAPTHRTPRWVWVVSEEEAKWYLYYYVVDRASFNQTLRDGTGLKVCLFLVENPLLLPVFVSVHTSDAWALPQMKLALAHAKRRAHGDETVEWRRKMFLSL